MATAVLQQQHQQASAEPDGEQRVKVFVSGCYDILHGGGLVALSMQRAALPAVQLLPALTHGPTARLESNPWKCCGCAAVLQHSKKGCSCTDFA
jgi:hypothetical protein